jgi:glucose/arabinose dehydrogenase
MTFFGPTINLDSPLAHLMRVRKGVQVQDFVTGFLQNGRVYGRPADVMSMGRNAFLFTNDYSGVVYYVFQKDSGSARAK